MTTNNPLVSVIIPAFNAEKTIAETLHSVQQQTYKALEIIVVDDGSTDSTASIVKTSFPEIRYIHQSNSGGCAVPRNTGIGLSTGELICFFDADDLMLPDRIRKQVELINSDSRIGVVFCNYQNFSESGGVSTSHFDTCPTLLQLLSTQSAITVSDACSLLIKENFGIAGSMLVRRKMLECVGGFNVDLTACEDFHFYYRIARVGAVGILREVGFLRRLHDSNMSGNTHRMLTNYIASRALLYAEEKNKENCRALAKFIADKHMSMAWILTTRRDFTGAIKNTVSALKWDLSFLRVYLALREFVRMGYYAARARGA